MKRKEPKTNGSSDESINDLLTEIPNLNKVRIQEKGSTSKGKKPQIVKVGKIKVS